MGAATRTNKPSGAAWGRECCSGSHFLPVFAAVLSSKKMPTVLETNTKSSTSAPVAVCPTPTPSPVSAGLGLAL